MNFHDQLRYDKFQLVNARHKSRIKGATNKVRTALFDSLKLPKTIEIAGRQILAMPLESIGMTSLQQQLFEDAGGLINPEPEFSIDPNYQDTMMYWTESFEKLQVVINGKDYRDFNLFRKVYEGFPDIVQMTEDEARDAGIYPIIHYRNFAARKWIAEMNGGYIATLAEDFEGELRDIYNAAKGDTSLDKLASMGQAPFGWRQADNTEIYGLGRWIVLGSTSLNDDELVRSLDAYSDDPELDTYGYGKSAAISSVVVLKNA